MFAKARDARIATCRWERIYSSSCVTTGARTGQAVFSFLAVKPISHGTSPAFAKNSVLPCAWPESKRPARPTRCATATLLPNELGALTLQNKAVIYNLLFRATAETLTEVAAGWKDLKAKIGFFAILHTWGQKLDFHPHLHCVVPGGGISLDGTRWVSCPRGFFMPVKLLSRKFRGKFLALLKQAHGRGELTLKGSLAPCDSPAAFKSWLSPLYGKEWVVYAKPPWNGPQHVLKYLARYTHRVAIANQRLLSIDGGQVTFSYKDYRRGHRQRRLTLSANEFIRRFMMHVLPRGFMRIRYYGFLANARRQQQLSKVRQLLNVPDPESTDPQADCLEQEQDPALDQCPHCQQGTMRLIATAFRPTIPQILELPLMVPM